MIDGDKLDCTAAPCRHCTRAGGLYFADVRAATAFAGPGVVYFCDLCHHAYILSLLPDHELIAGPVRVAAVVDDTTPPLAGSASLNLVPSP